MSTTAPPRPNVGIQLLFGCQPTTLVITGHRVVQREGSFLIAVDESNVRYVVGDGGRRDWVLYPMLAEDRIDEENAIHVAKVESNPGLTC